MESNLAISGWRKLILAGQFLNELKLSLVLQGKINLVQEVEKYENFIANYFMIFDFHLSIENVPLETMDIENLSISDLKSEFGIIESFFDFFELDINIFTENLLKISEQLIYFHSDLVENDCSDNSQNIVWKICDELNELIIMFDPNLDI